MVNRRGAFELALSQNSLREVFDRRSVSYLRWAYDVLDYWEGCLVRYGHPSPGMASLLAEQIEGGSFQYLSVKDRALIRDAVVLGCDAFLTVELRLPKNADDVRRRLGLLILRPVQLWDLVGPWAGLF